MIDALDNRDDQDPSDLPSESIESRLESRLSEFPERIPDPERLNKWGKRIMLAILVTAATFVIIGISTGTLRSLEAFQQFIAGIGPIGPIIYMGLVAAQTIFPVVPGAVGILAGPILFGPMLGFLFNWIAISVGSITSFLIARHLGISIITRLFPAKLIDKFDAWTNNPRFTKLFALAILFPVAPDDLLCYLAGTTKMKLSTYIPIIIIGKAPSLLIYSFGLTAAIHWIGGLFG